MVSKTQTLKLERINPISANVFYRGTHWRARKEIVDIWHNLAWALANEQKIQPVIIYPVDLVFVCYLPAKWLMDATNLFLMAKLVEDALVKGAWIASDDPKHVRSMTCHPVIEIGPPWAEMTIYE